MWEDPWLPYQGRFKVLTWKSLGSNMLWIRDLIDQKGQKWNIPVIENVFLPYDSQLILQISFDSLDQEDTIMWTRSKKWKLHGENKILLFFYILKRREILVALLKRTSLVFEKSFETPKPFRELRLYIGVSSIKLYQLDLNSTKKVLISLFTALFVVLRRNL